MRDVVSDGVTGITLAVTDGNRVVIVRSNAGEFTIYAKGVEEQMGITPVPRKVDPYPGTLHAP